MSVFDRLIEAHENGDLATVLTIADAALRDQSVGADQRLGILLYAFDARIRLGESADSEAIAHCLSDLTVAANALPGDAPGRYHARELVARHGGDVSALPAFTGHAAPHPPGELQDSSYDWESLENAGVASEPLVELGRHNEQSGADGWLLMVGGKLVAEWYGPVAQHPMTAKSSTKSIGGLLTGLLLVDGRLDGVDQPVGDFIPSWCEGLRGLVTVRHLLSMTAGFERILDDRCVGYTHQRQERSCARHGPGVPARRAMELQQ